jgi:anaerobic ribonucleoside-triphosphate reductase
MAEKKVPCEVYSRIVGYLRPVQNWNKGKRQEFKERATYRVEKERAEAAQADK